jgi:hypothetical protein
MVLIPSAVGGDYSLRLATAYPRNPAKLLPTLPGLSQATAEFSFPVAERGFTRFLHVFYMKIVLSRQPGLTSSCGATTSSSS